MTRAEVLKSYEVGQDGIIKSLGKFENEMLYIPYFWSQGLQGSASEDIGTVYFFIIDDEDRKMFPELGTAYGIALEESEQGFVYSVEYENQAAYNVAVNQAQLEDGSEEDEKEDAE